MRQVGARDEARLLADYETCGRECCCKNFLKNLKPISMSMAKLQKTTLDLSKVSGRCGRLKCCLRYEHETYQTLEKRLPRNGTRVATSHGTGRVVDRQVLTQLVRVHTDEGRLITVVVEDILETDVPPPDPQETPSRPPRRERDARRPSSTLPPAPPAARPEAAPAPPETEPEQPPPSEDASAPPSPATSGGAEASERRTEQAAAPKPERTGRSRRRGRRRRGGRSNRGKRDNRSDGPPPKDP
jgi:hypothetical protein